MRHKKKRHGSDGVKLNLAAMLDMAFQLLAFFILTYKPSPVEGQLALHLPPPSPIKKDNPNVKQPVNPNAPPQLPGVEAIVIIVKANPNGDMTSLQVMGRTIFTGPGSQRNMLELDKTLRDLMKFNDPPFEQVVIRVAKSLRYEELMKIIDVCTRQKKADGKPMTEVRFTELPGEEKAGG